MMSKTARSTSRLPEQLPMDLSPSTIARYRALAERERSKVLAQMCRRIFEMRPTFAERERYTVPAE